MATGKIFQLNGETILTLDEAVIIRRHEVHYLPVSALTTTEYPPELKRSSERIRYALEHFDEDTLQKVFRLQVLLEPPKKRVKFKKENRTVTVTYSCRTCKATKESNFEIPITFPEKDGASQKPFQIDVEHCSKCPEYLAHFSLEELIHFICNHTVTRSF